MIKIRFSSLLFVFFLCFSSFILGWLVAVYIIPGNLLQKRADQKGLKNIQLTSSFLKSDKENPSAERTGKQTETKTGKTMPFFEEIRDNILFLFNPYKMDSLMKKNTFLETKNNYIKDKTQILVETQAPVQEALNEKNNKNTSQNLDKLKSPSDNSSLEEPSPLEPRFKTKEEKDNEILQKLQAEYDESNRKQLLQILEDQQFFAVEGRFSFLVNVFSEQKQALDYVKTMKKDYPLWSFLIKAYKDHIRIYLGPFESKERALEFQKTIPQPSPFPQEFLEEVSL